MVKAIRISNSNLFGFSYAFAMIYTIRQKMIYQKITLIPAN